MAVLREFEKRADIEIISYAIPGSTRVIDLISIRYRFDIDRCFDPTSMLEKTSVDNFLMF